MNFQSLVFLIYLAIPLSGLRLTNTSCDLEALNPSDTTTLIQPLDILINEILPNPKTGGAEFIELYNASAKTFNLEELQLARVIGRDSLISTRPISDTPALLFPNEYKVVTKNPSIVQLQYYTENPKAFIMMANMPQLPNKSGSVALISNHTIIDRLDYQEEMHSAFIKDPKGVSLERRNFTAATNAAGNFTSAAASVGYATPGYRNSQYQPTENEGDAIWLTSKTFSPDLDGFEDVLQINYRFKKTGNMLTLSIFNDRGKIVRQLYRSYSLGETGVLTWDGQDDAQQRLPVGIYILHLAVYNATDGVKNYRKSCVLAAKF